MAGILENHPGYGRSLLAMATLALQRNDRLRAFKLTRRAVAFPEVATAARALLASLLPGYHVPMMNDARRNEAWDRALRRAIRPGMHVLEIGTGAGMLALMAARAGAGLITTCERDPVAAAIATEIAASNGYADRIHVIAEASQDLTLDAPADLLFCDIFSNNLIGFDPLSAIADARSRLLVANAPVVPASVAIRLALAQWSGYERFCQTGRAAGFDISPFSCFATRPRTLRVGDPGLHLRSADYEAFRFDLAAPSHPAAGRIELQCEAASNGIVNGIVQWIRLELDAETALESRPEPGAEFFSAPHFHPFAEPLVMRAGDGLLLTAAYAGKELIIGLN
ncbi:MAG: 50S ribosomal protein L11 methyltransferase [Terriglobia bacterium]